jgi:hypothetical protein
MGAPVYWLYSYLFLCVGMPVYWLYSYLFLCVGMPVYWLYSYLFLRVGMPVYWLHAGVTVILFYCVQKLMAACIYLPSYFHCPIDCCPRYSALNSSIRMSFYSQSIQISGQEYILFNTSQLLELPTKDKVSMELGGLRTFQTPQWFSLEHPFLPYIAVHPRFSGSIFSRLRVFPDVAPVRRHQGKWWLSPDIVNTWMRLEQALILVKSCLIVDRGILSPLDCEGCRLPSSYGFTAGHTEERYLRAAIRRSRDAFVTYSAYVSYIIAAHSGNSSEGGVLSTHPAWIKALCDKGIHPEWVTDLRRSFVGDFSIPRVGAWAKVAEPGPGWDLELWSVARAGIPLCVRYDGNFHALARFKGYRKPTRDSIILPPPPAPEPSPSPLPPVKTHRVANGSGQRPDETMDEFFKRREVEDQERMLAMNPESRGQYQSRKSWYDELVKKRGGMPCPGRNSKSPSVFVWEDEEGFYVRQRVDRSSVADIWEYYKEAQRRYNAVRNEWDLAALLDPDVEPANPVDYSEFESEYEPDIALQDSNVRRDVDASDLGVIEKDMADIHGAVPSVEAGPSNQPNVVPESHEWPWEDLQQVLAFRYGFEVLATYQSPLPSPHHIRLSDAMGILAEMDTLPHPPVASRASQAIVDFIHCLLAGCEALIPPGVWDLRDSSPLRTMSMVSLDIKRHVNLDGCVFYSLAGTGAAYRIFVQSAADVLHSIRLQESNVVLVAQHLIERGVRFHTRRLGHAPAGSRSVKPFVGLGSRPAQYRPTFWDYAGYRATRNAFLETPGGRASLLQGGIVARIAREVLPVEAGAVGPSADAEHTGCYVEIDGQFWWDDDLTEEQIGLIVGAYSHESRGMLFNFI